MACTKIDEWAMACTKMAKGSFWSASNFIKETSCLMTSSYCIEIKVRNQVKVALGLKCLITPVIEIICMKTLSSAFIVKHSLFK